LTVAAFMDLALYHPTFGYYARAVQRSGRAGDFFTSVDVGSVFGELLEVQIAEMADILGGADRPSHPASMAHHQTDWALVEAGAGNGRLSADILRAARARDPHLYERARLHLVEASADARAAQQATLGDMADRLATSSDALPAAFEGVTVANELLDALPAHQVVMRPEGLREVYVDLQGGRLVTRDGPLSTPALGAYLDRLEAVLEPGWRVEINLRAVSWIRDVARRLTRGFLILIDYGHDARALYSATHARGTLTTFAHHTMHGPDAEGAEPSWLQRPGEQDITSHVDFTTVRATAEAEGLVTLGFLDQTYFLMGLVPKLEHLGRPEYFKQRLALKTLLLPGGLGSTHKVLIFGKGVGHPALAGCSYKMRVT
jgi:SAM-dependent MidA family methyltransferase